MLLIRRFRFCLRNGFSHWYMSQYIGVDGWLSENEACFLYRTTLDLARRDLSTAEIGSWLGKSSVVICSALKQGKGGFHYCIDPFNADTSDLKAKKIFQNVLTKYNYSQYEIFLDNIKGAGVSEFAVPLNGYCKDVMKKWHKLVDLVFIDGDHSYDNVKQDFELFEPHIRTGGIVCFHDACYNDGNFRSDPGRFVKENIVDNPNWDFLAKADSIYAIKKVN